MNDDDADGAVLSFLSASGPQCSPVEPGVCADLLLCLAKQGRIADAYGVLAHLSERHTDSRLALPFFCSLVCALPQRTKVDEALPFMERLEQHVAFRDQAGHAHFHHFSRLIVQEHLTEAEGCFDRIAGRSARSLAEANLAVLDVRMAGPGSKPGTLELASSRAGVDVVQAAKLAFSKGDVVLIQPMQESRDAMGGLYGASFGGGGGLPRVDSMPGIQAACAPVSCGWECEVLAVGPTFSVRLLRASDAKELKDAPPSLRVDKLGNRVTFGRMIDALRAFADGAVDGRGPEEAMRDIVCGNHGEAGCAALCSAPVDGVHAARLASVAAHAAHQQGMNPSQKAALQAGLTRRLTLVQGPPGTGKTATAVALVKLWLAAGMGPVMACSDSNTAVDNLLEGLHRAGARVLRVGRSESVRQELLHLTLEYASGAVALPGTRPYGTPALPRDQQFRLQQEALRRAEVVCCTCSGAGSDAMEKLIFGCVLLDEASQATEPAALAPLCRGARCVALVGDHRQLPPTCVSRQAAEAGLSVSLFDRLAKCGVPPLLLDVQYRMHPALAAFPARMFYDDRLRSGVRCAARPPPRGFAWPLPGVPLAFLPVAGFERGEGTSHTNAQEADAVASVVHALLCAGDLRPCDIGVVTPYAAQVRLLRRALAPMRGAAQAQGGAPPLEVASVDGFQGREKEVIVFSAVRANAGGAVGFLADARRLNVMLTRARRGLVVCGHLQTLRAEASTWGSWMAWALEAGLVVGMPPGCAQASARLRGTEACAVALAEVGDSALVPQAAAVQAPRARERSRSRSRERRKRSRERSRERSRSRSRKEKKEKRHKRRSRSRSRRSRSASPRKRRRSHSRSRSRSRRQSRSPVSRRGY